MPKIIIKTLRVTSLNGVTEKGEKIFATIGNIAKSPVKGGGDLIQVIDNDLTKTLTVGAEIFAAIICENNVPGRDKVAKLLCYPFQEKIIETALPKVPDFVEDLEDEAEDEYLYCSSYSKNHGKDHVRYNTKEYGKSRTPKVYKEKGGAKNRLSFC